MTHSQGWLVGLDRLPFSGSDGRLCQRIHQPDSLEQIIGELGARVDDIKPIDSNGLNGAITFLQCDAISCLGLGLPIPFLATQFASEYATVSLPFSGLTHWWNDEQKVVEQGGRSIVYIAPRSDIHVRNKGSLCALVYVPLAVMENAAFRMARGTVSERKIRAALARSCELQLSNDYQAPLIKALYSCIHTLDALSGCALPDYSDLSVDDSFIRILIQLLIPEIRQNRISAAAGKPKGARMRELEEWMKQNLGSKLTLSQLEDFCGYSARSIHNYFAAQYQLSPKQWIIKQRIAKAFSLISQGDERSMGLIAKECGYSDSSRFARHFQAEYGFSPRYCRQKRCEVSSALFAN